MMWRFLSVQSPWWRVFGEDGRGTLRDRTHPKEDYSHHHGKRDAYASQRGNERSQKGLYHFVQER